MEKQLSLRSVPPARNVDRYQLGLRHCLDAEVTGPRMKYLTFKAAFCNQLKHLRLKGNKLDAAYKLEAWVSDNLDQFYES